MKLTDTLEEQRIVEHLVEAAKPPVPPECRHLDPLLYTPFRYSPYPFDSRFRKKGDPRGVFYASEGVETAVSERAFQRLLFFAESPDTPWPENSTEYTAFQSEIKTDNSLDLTKPPLNTDPAWVSLADYSACAQLAETARTVGIDVIRYKSVRDPNGGVNLAVLRCAAFARSDAIARQTWRFHLGPHGVRCICESPRLSFMFDRHTFAADPRLVGFSWDRS